MHRRYHVDLGIPDEVEYPVVGHALTYTVHAYSEAQKDRASTRLPTSLPDYALVEVETSGPYVTQWVVRVGLDGARDLCLVITRDYVVKTVWVNRHDDAHDTLDRTKYDRPRSMTAVH